MFERWEKRTGRLILLLVCAALVLQLAGCSAVKKLFGGEDEEAALKIEFDEDTLFVIGNRKVSLAEWFLYMQPKAEEMRALYGTEIFDYSLESIDKKMAEALKEEVKSNIVYIKTVCGQAQSLGIALNEDDMIDVNLMVEDYLLELSDMPEHDRELFEKLGINEELIRKTYADNQLATKVYEYLTLNVDTTIPEDDVRFMILQYVTFLKYKTGQNDENTEMTEEELEAVKTEAEAFETRVRTDESVTKLSDMGDSVTVSELIIDKAGLEDSLGERIADEAFALKQGQISPLIETEEAFFLLDCISESDTEMTNAAKVKIIEERQATVFDESYAKWEEQTPVYTNEALWAGLEVLQ